MSLTLVMVMVQQFKQIAVVKQLVILYCNVWFFVNWECILFLDCTFADINNPKSVIFLSGSYVRGFNWTTNTFTNCSATGGVGGAFCSIVGSPVLLMTESTFTNCISTVGG
jgi:hypothetical protein